MAGKVTDRRRKIEGAASSARAAAPEGAPAEGVAGTPTIGNGRKSHRSTYGNGRRGHRASFEGAATSEGAPKDPKEKQPLHRAAVSSE
jgi:hypothetical protein